ncbi:ATP-binding protein [Spirillospora albida]|uniref:ATP-binding protein n=1 Tax=Spirillospora albida TaxID=58123 RepID=UPI0004C056DF|nr:ATP-binding protein [Spirillospora albida]
MVDVDREKALIALLDRVTRVASTAEDLETAAGETLAAVCELSGWRLGHLCVPSGRDDVFVSSGLWVGATEEFAALREITSRMEFEPGLSIVGRVVATRAPLWSHEAAEDPLFVRGQISEVDLGVGAAFAFPVMASDGSVAAVMEFFSHRASPPDETLLRVMASLGHLLGGVVDRRRARRALEAERNRLEQVIQTSVEAFVGMDRDGRIIGWNAAAERMFGLSPDEAIGRVLADTIIPPRYREAHHHGMARFMATGRARLLGHRFEITALGPDGTEFPIELAIWAFPDADGGWVFNAFLHDVTDRRRAERALRSAYEREQANVARLRDLDRAKNDFIALVSHELRTPLTTILAYLEMLAEGDAGEVPPAQGRILGTMTRNGLRLRRLVEDLLTVTAMDTGGLTLNLGRVSVRDVIAEAVALARDVEQAEAVEVAVEVTDAAGEVDGDREHLVKAVSSLMSNAMQITAPGTRVDVRADRRDGTVSISVTDHGPGLGPEEIPHVFDRFFRTRRAEEQALQGLGLGLTIAKTIVEAHGGALAVRSVPPGGATFTITLPAGGQGGQKAPGEENR